MLDGLFGGGCAPKCKSLIKRIKSRIDILRKKRIAKANLLRQDVAQLIKKGRDDSAFSRVELLLIELSLLHGYNMIESFCDSILKQLSYIQKQKECPQDVREAVLSLIFAAARCADLPELQGLRDIFATKYGNEFAVAAVELFPDCGVNQQMIEKLLATAISSDAKLKLMKEIEEKPSFRWDPSNLEDGSQGLQGFKSSHNETPLHHHPLSDKSPVDGTPIHSLNNNGSAYSKSSNTAEKHEGAVLNKRVEMASRSVGCEEDIYDTGIPVISSSARDMLVNPDAAGAAAEAVGHEDSSNKPCIKQSIADHAFDASSERQEDNRNLRYSATRPRTNKISRHISSVEGNDLKREYSNGCADTLFPKEGNGVCERDSGLRSGEQLKSDTAYRSRTSWRASHLLVDGGEPQELSEGPETRKLEDQCGITRRGSIVISNDLNRRDANGVSTGSHRRHSRASHLTVDREEPQAFSERPENRKLQDDCSITRRESIGTNNASNRREANGVWAGSQRTHSTGSVCKDQDNELKRFDRPVWDVNAGQEHESEFCDLPQTRSKAKSKSSKILDHCAVEKKSLYHSENDGNAGRFVVGNRANQPVIEPSVEETMGRKQYSEHYLESQECFTSNRSSLHNPDKLEPTWQHSEDKTSYKAYNGRRRSHNRFQYCDDEDSNDSIFVRNENLYAVSDGLSQAHERVSSRASSRRVNYVDEEALFDDARHSSRRASSEPQHREEGTVQERLSSRESSRRVNYVDEEATFDDARHSSRRASNKGNNFGKLRSYEGVNNFQRSEHEGKYETYYSDEQRFYENNDSNPISVDRLPSEPQHREEGTVQERVSIRESSRRVNYVDEEATFDDAKHSSRRASNKGNNFGKFRSYEGVNNFQQLEHEGKYETYHSDEQRLQKFYENNPISVDSLPSERQHKEGTKLGKHVFRANHRLHGSNESSITKNLNQIDDQDSDLEAQSSRESEYTKEYTKTKYLQNAEALKRPNGSRRTHERKTQKESDNLVDSLNTYHMEKHNSNIENHYLQEYENPESYVKETPLAGDKSERRHSHRRHRREGRLSNGSIKLPEFNEGYSANKEQLANGLDDDEHEGKISSEKHYRYDKQHCESKQKVHHTSGDSNVGIVGEANGLRHYSEQDKDRQSGRRHAIPEVECSPVKGKRHDIQDANSCTTRDTRSAFHRDQSHNHNQSVYSESAIVEKCSRSMMPQSNQEVRDSCASPYDFSINGCNAPPSPKPPAPARASVPSESLSQVKPQYGKMTGSPPQRPPRGQQRAVSLPAEHSHSTPLHPNFSKSSSDVGPCQMVHVHPKLPDYDDLAARFAALRQQDKTK